MTRTETITLEEIHQGDRQIEGKRINFRFGCRPDIDSAGLTDDFRTFGGADTIIRRSF